MKVFGRRIQAITLLLATTATVMFIIKTHYEASRSMDAYIGNLRHSHMAPYDLLAAEAEAEPVATTAPSVKLHKEEDNVSLRSESDVDVAPDHPSSSAPRNHDNVSLRPESDVATVPIQANNATIAITLSPPATKEKGLVYFHVGKTGGVTLNRVLRSNCDSMRSKNGRKICLRLLESTYHEELPLSKLVKKSIHVEKMTIRHAKDELRDYGALWSVRNPIDRAISALDMANTRNDRKQKKKELSKEAGLVDSSPSSPPTWREIFYEHCGFGSAQDLADAIESDRPKHVQIQLNETETMVVDCIKEGRNEIEGRGSARTHLFFNYAFYKRQADQIQQNPIYVLRTEHLWEDVIQTNRVLLGMAVSAASTTSEQEVDNPPSWISDLMKLKNSNHMHTHGSEGYIVKSRLNQKQRETFCCYLSEENQIYENLLWAAVNLSSEQKFQTMMELYQDCGILPPFNNEIRDDGIVSIKRQQQAGKDQNLMMSLLNNYSSITTNSNSNNDGNSSSSGFMWKEWRSRGCPSIRQRLGSNQSSKLKTKPEVPNSSSLVGDNESTRTRVQVRGEKESTHGDTKETSAEALDFIHITKTGGTSIEGAAAQIGIAWGYCKYHPEDKFCIPSPSRNHRNRSTMSMDTKCKIGGPKKTSVALWHCPPNHLQMNEGNNNGKGGQTQHQVHHQSNINTSKTFAIVRDPYSRIISEYYWAHSWARKDEKHSTAEYLNSWIKKQLALVEKFGACVHGHCIPMYKYTHDDSLPQPSQSNTATLPRQVADHIIHLENITVELPVLMEQYGHPYKDIQLGKEKHKGRRTDDKLDVHNLTNETLCMINRWAEMDFKLFGYEMIEVAGCFNR